MRIYVGMYLCVSKSEFLLKAKYKRGDREKHRSQQRRNNNKNQVRMRTLNTEAAAAEAVTAKKIGKGDKSGVDRETFITAVSESFRIYAVYSM